MPNLYIIAGCNGAGKTTASYTVLPEMLNCKEFVNADEIAKGISPFQAEKALLILILISYIQPFADGNKRTARIVSNAILMNNKCCPISYRTVDSIEYKKAMLLFYEQNNLTTFKEIFINQFEFAVNTYF